MLRSLPTLTLLTLTLLTLTHPLTTTATPSTPQQLLSSATSLAASGEFSTALPALSSAAAAALSSALSTPSCLSSLPPLPPTPEFSDLPTADTPLTPLDEYDEYDEYDENDEHPTPSQECLELVSVAADALQNAAFCATKVGNHSTAQVFLTPILALPHVDPGRTAKTHSALGIVYIGLAEYELARSHIQVALQADPLPAPQEALQMFYGDALLGLDLVDDAVAAFATSYSSVPRRSVLNKIGLALASAHRHQEAAEWYERGVEDGVLREGLTGQRPDTLDPSLEGKPVWDVRDAVPNGKLADFVSSGLPRVVAEVNALLKDNPDALREWYVATGDIADYAHDAHLFECVDPGCPETRWHQIPLWEVGSPTEAAFAFPDSIQAFFDTMPEVLKYGRLLFSVLHPGVVIKPHVGPTNARLTVHCGVSIPDDPDLHIRVDQSILFWENNECFVFDDSFEHEVIFTPANPDSVTPRVALLFHIPHPQLKLQD